MTSEKLKMENYINVKLTHLAVDKLPWNKLFVRITYPCNMCR